MARLLTPIAQNLRNCRKTFSLSSDISILSTRQILLSQSSKMASFIALHSLSCYILRWYFSHKTTKTPKEAIRSRLRTYCPFGVLYSMDFLLRQLFLCCAVLCCAVLCCAVLCCAVLCCAVLCCAVLCCAVLCCEKLAAGWHSCQLPS